MNRTNPVSITTLLNQQPLRKLSKERESLIQFSFESNKNCEGEMNQLKKKNFSKLFVSDYSNQLSKIEFSKSWSECKDKSLKKPSSLQETVKKIQEYYQQQESSKNIVNKKQELPEFIRERDQQKKEMQKLIRKNQQQVDGQENQSFAQVYLIELVLIISILYMWKKLFDQYILR